MWPLSLIIRDHLLPLLVLLESLSCCFQDSLFGLLKVQSRCLFLFGFTILGVHWTSGIWRLMFFIIFEKFSVVLFLQIIILLHFFPCFPWIPIMYMIDAVTYLSFWGSVHFYPFTHFLFPRLDNLNWLSETDIYWTLQILSFSVQKFKSFV